MVFHMTGVLGWLSAGAFQCLLCDLYLQLDSWDFSTQQLAFQSANTVSASGSIKFTTFKWSMNVTEPAQVLEGKLTWELWQSHIAKDMQDGGNCCGCLWKQSYADMGFK